MVVDGAAEDDAAICTSRCGPRLGREDPLGYKFARKAFEVLEPAGVAIFWEAVHNDDSPTPMALAMESVLDLGVSPTGCVLTRGSMTDMLTGIGFREIEFVTCLGGETSFVVARK